MFLRFIDDLLIKSTGSTEFYEGTERKSLKNKIWFETINVLDILEYKDVDKLQERLSRLLNLITDKIKTPELISRKHSFQLSIRGY